jgi:hypothetical protein
MFSAVTLIQGGNIPPRKNDFEALTGISIEAATPTKVYSGKGADEEVKVVYMKDLNHGSIPNNCFYNFLEQGQCLG